MSLLNKSGDHGLIGGDAWHVAELGGLNEDVTIRHSDARALFARPRDALTPCRAARLLFPIDGGFLRPPRLAAQPLALCIALDFLVGLFQVFVCHFFITKLLTLTVRSDALI